MVMNMTTIQTWRGHKLILIYFDLILFAFYNIYDIS